MRRKIIQILIIFFIICIFFLFSWSASRERKTVKIGIIDSYIQTQTLESMNITHVNYTNINKQTSNIHEKVTLKIIQSKCKNSEIYYASVLDENNTSSIENIVSALNWCIENKVDVICMSFATLTDDSLLKDAINKALSKNIIITASCINLSDKKYYPAMYDGVISVSEGLNKNATIIMKNKKISVMIDGKKLQKTGTSVSNAYVCGYISDEISKGNEDIKGIIKNISKDVNKS